MVNGDRVCDLFKLQKIIKGALAVKNSNGGEYGLGHLGMKIDTHNRNMNIGKSISLLTLDYHFRSNNLVYISTIKQLSK